MNAESKPLAIAGTGTGSGAALAIAIVGVAIACAAMFSLAGCTGESGRTAPAQQQGVSDVIRQQTQSSASHQTDAAPESSFAGGGPTYDKVDFDLTAMGSDMVYATVNDMMTYPGTYVGKVVRMTGPFYHSRDDVHGADYYYVIVQDATACCAQGLEFVWGDGTHAWPGDYPAENEEVVVTGVFETYTERTLDYIHLVDASLELA